MISQKSTITGFEKLRNRISNFLIAGKTNFNGETMAYEKFVEVTKKAGIHNQWFTESMVIKAFEELIVMLEPKAMQGWINNYNFNSDKPFSQKKVGIIMAGNIPMVGFHDLLCVLISGHKAVVKLSSDDTVLMTYIIESLMELEPSFQNQIEIAERLNDMDAVIATGSNNSSRYFEYYFGRKPHIIRKNRNSVAVINGNETHEQLVKLGDDIFCYFGLGCRNVSKLYVPDGYVFDKFFEAIFSFADLMNHNKYINNYNYQRSVLLMNSEPFLTNDFLIVKAGKPLSTPVAILNFETYSTIDDLKIMLESENNSIQCVVSDNESVPGSINFGNSQSPAIDDYPDRVDTMSFLLSL